MDEDIDLEDIETRLYGQIYHGTPEEETVPNPPSIIPCIPQNGPTSNLRYYSNQVFIPFDTSANPRYHYQNPNRSLGEPKQPVASHPNNNSNSQINKRAKAERKKERRRMNKIKMSKILLKNYVTNRPNPRYNFRNLNSEIVCLSDDEDSVEVQNTESMGTEKDDDVIFVEPEPVPIIDLDVEDSKSESDASTVQLNLSPPDSVNSNDFLENSTHEDLPQSRFNSTPNDITTSHFIKPTNPSDMYETESSCSTTDLSKDIANALKAVVFNEIEFPKEDMFSGNNLDDFSNYITPQRNSQQNSSSLKVSGVSKQTKSKQITSNDADSDSSSSESEYEQPVNNSNDVTGKQLPVLSDMQAPVVEDTGKNKKKKSKSVENLNKNPVETTKKKKRKKNEVETPVLEGRKRKKSKRMEMPPDVDTSLNDSAINESDLDLSVSNIEQPIVSSEVDLSCGDQTTSQSNVEGSSEVQTTQKDVTSTSDGGKKRKKSKKSDNNPQIDPENLESNSNNVSTESRKKKKKRNETSKDFTLSELQIETPMASEDPPRPCSASSVSTIEHHESINLENEHDNKDNSGPIEEFNDDTEDVILIEQPIETIDLVESSIVEEETESRLSKSLNETIDPSLDFSALEVVDEVGSTSENDDKEINASENDFRTFDDVGNDLDLANCSHNSFYIRDFNVEEIQNTMSDDPNKWKIIARDRLILEHRNIGPKCFKCHEVGHLGARCPVKFTLPRCSLCGIEGHIDTRCPNKVCTQCGTKGLYSTRFCWNCAKYRNVICTLCKMFGHINANCPDLWRRYYLTTEAGPLVPDNPLRMKSTKDLWCCGCARPGHLEHNCMQFDRPYPPSLPYIQSFDDVYTKGQNRENSTQNKRNDDNVYANKQSTENSTQNKRNNDNVYGNEQNREDVIPNKRNIILNEGTSGQTCISIQITNSPTVITDSANSFPLINKQNFFGREEDLTQDPGFDGVMFNEMEQFPETRAGSKHEKYFALFRKIIHGDVKTMKKFAFTNPKVLQNLINENLIKMAPLRDLTASDINQLMSEYKSLEAAKHRITVKMRKRVYQKANMVLFGVHTFGNGKRYMDLLRSFANFGPKNFSTKKRISLYEAYCYIFAAYKNVSINYTKLFRILINRLENHVT